MKISIGIRWDGQEGFDEQASYVREAEQLGVDAVWTLEGWGADAVTPLAYLAGQTSRIRLGTSIMQISARVPAMTAMTALSLAALSGNRFVLGLGVSGPQVVEGLHGVAFARPLTRLRETVELIRQACAGEKLTMSGRTVRLPRPGGEGKALRLSLPPNPRLPIYLATLGPRSLAYTGAVADGWLGTAFVPEQADAHLAPIRAGARAAGRDLSAAGFEVSVGAAEVEFGDVRQLVSARKMGRAFTIGAMGSEGTNFYSDAYQRSGWGEETREIQSLWRSGRRKEAAALVPDGMITRTNLLGDETNMKDRLRAYAAAGVTALKVQPIGDRLADRLAVLERIMDMARDVG